MKQYGLYWFKFNNLRILDNCCLARAHQNCEFINHVCVFDTDQFCESASVQPKFSINRLKFQVECVNSINKHITYMGGNFQAYIGPTCYIFQNMFATSSQINELHTIEEVVHDEKLLQDRVQSLAMDFNVQFHQHYDFGSLVSPALLPFPLQELTTFSNFRKSIEEAKILSSPAISPYQPDSSFTYKAGFPLTVTDYPAINFSHHTTIEELTLFIWNTLCQLTHHPEWSLTAIPKDDPRSAIYGLPGGEEAAHRRLTDYFRYLPSSAEASTSSTPTVLQYKSLRNGMLGRDYSTKCSIYLARGCLTSRQILAHIQTAQLLNEGERVEEGAKGEGEDRMRMMKESIELIIAELLWQDYMYLYSILYGKKPFALNGPHFNHPQSVNNLLNNNIDNNNTTSITLLPKHPWRKELSHLQFAWEQGLTGYPFIDACMRELKLTGYLSNRGRQVVASFLVRDLQLDWRIGAAHFERYLLDYDVCVNYGNWQYSAGVGNDPRGDRYFHVIKQAMMYDPEAEFIRHWMIPEVIGYDSIPNEKLLDPMTISEENRQQYGMMNSEEEAGYYPRPIVPLMVYTSLVELRDNLSKKDSKTKKKMQKKNKHGSVPGLA